MSRPLTRRRVLATAPAAVAGWTLLRPVPSVAAASEPVPSLYPIQDPDVVREVVGKSHFDLERVRELVEARPELARAAWDWGFGDWETALGAASHTGRREIAEYLISRGARPNLFTFAMLGHVDIVRATIAARPGVQRIPGPHGITLLDHARAGKEAAAPVVDYLESIGGADEGPVDLPMEGEARGALLGFYAYGAGAQERFEVSVDERDRLSLRRAEGVARRLFHQGDDVFHPSGAPSARIRFLGDAGAVTALEIRNPHLVLRAERV